MVLEFNERWILIVFRRHFFASRKTTKSSRKVGRVSFQCTISVRCSDNNINWLQPNSCSIYFHLLSVRDYHQILAKIAIILWYSNLEIVIVLIPVPSINFKKSSSVARYLKLCLAPYNNAINTFRRCSWRIAVYMLVSHTVQPPFFAEIYMSSSYSNRCPYFRIIIVSLILFIFHIQRTDTLFIFGLLVSFVVCLAIVSLFSVGLNAFRGWCCWKIWKIYLERDCGEWISMSKI